MTPPDPKHKFVGIQISPISFVDEGVEAVLDTLQHRVGVNVLMLGTVSWLGLKSGRSISHALDGWPDHGVPVPYQMRGGAYFDPDPRYYRETFMADYRSRDPEFEGKDILKMVVPEAHARGMKVYIELMEPFFKYAGHGSAAAVEIPTLAQAMEVDLFGRFAQRAVDVEPRLPHLDPLDDRGPKLITGELRVKNAGKFSAVTI